MAEIKTKPSAASVQKFLNEVPDGQRRKDAVAMVDLLGEITKADATMWGESIIGFGTHRMRYPNGREIDWMQVGFSPRKDNLTLYISGGLGTHEHLLQGLGKFKTSKGNCLYIKKLSDINTATLEQLVRASIQTLDCVQQ